MSDDRAFSEQNRATVAFKKKIKVVGLLDSVNPKD